MVDLSGSYLAYIALPKTGFVRLPVVLKHIPVARSTWWDGVRTGRFPAGVKIGGVTAWRVEDINELIATISGGSVLPPQRDSA